MRHQRSETEFSMGVPVRPSVKRAFMLLAAWVMSDEVFLTFCISSKASTASFSLPSEML